MSTEDENLLEAVHYLKAAAKRRNLTLVEEEEAEIDALLRKPPGTQQNYDSRYPVRNQRVPAERSM
jgi:hypothetical protein